MMKKFKQKTTQNEDTHVVKSDNLSVSPNEDKKKELSAILNVLGLSSEQILDHIHQEFQAQSHKQFEKQEILKLLTSLSTESIDDSEANDEEKKMMMKKRKMNLMMQMSKKMRMKKKRSMLV